MNKPGSQVFLLICAVFYFFLPYVASRIRWEGTIYPQTPPGHSPGYGLFPDQFIVAPPGFNLTVFIIVAAFCAFVLLFILFPALFGFKKNNASGKSNSAEKSKVRAKIKSKTPFPTWYLPSLIIFVLSWIINWARWPYPVDKYIFIPLWWSFIFLMDAIVYKRNNGESIFSGKPATFKLIFAVSSVAWFSFEYLNFFYVELWYYPVKSLMTDFGFVFWYLLSFTVVWPGIFEFYTLLRTFKSLRLRYKFGPKIHFSKTVQIFLLIAGFAIAFLSGLYPHQFFWGLWIYPLLVSATALSVAGYPNIFSSIKSGNWSYVVLIGLASLGNGFFYELWNEGSNMFHSTLPDNPNFWRYSVPYVDVIHIFSQMPLLGYFGYIGFGSIMWSIWLIFAHVLDFSPEFDPVKDD
ncbi:MAG: small-conductance mechanosensitive channel [Spirochaetia bacterium]|nr:small-conductance mechanosensitive channel [Spirochaetia bacterium]